MYATSSVRARVCFGAPPPEFDEARRRLFLPLWFSSLRLLVLQMLGREQFERGRESRKVHLCHAAKVHLVISLTVNTPGTIAHMAEIHLHLSHARTAGTYLFHRINNLPRADGAAL